MTPKQKAEELLNKYLNYVSGWTTINKPDEDPAAQYEGKNMKLGRAKQCALIAVDEIIDNIPIKVYHEGIYNNLEDRIEDVKTYWEIVKHEINSL